MNKELELAKQRLLESGYTCVVKKEEVLYTSRERGVKPLLMWLDEGMDLKGFYAADKVIGNGAAMLYVLLGVKEIYTCVVSRTALETLQSHNIVVFYDVCVDYIVNRAGTGPCPIESAVEGIKEPEKALPAIRRKLQELAHSG